MFYRRFYIEKLGILIIFLYTTNQHQKYDIFNVEHFFQNSKLTHDRAHRDHRALVDQERGNRGESDQGLILSFGKSVQHKKCHIFDAD